MKFHLFWVLISAFIIGCGSSEDETPVLRDDEEENLSVSDLTFSGAESGRKVGGASLFEARTTDDLYLVGIILGNDESDIYSLNISRIHPEPIKLVQGSYTIGQIEEGGGPSTNFVATLFMGGSNSNKMYMPFGEDTGGTFSIDRTRTIGEREYVEGNLSLTLATPLDESDRVSVEGTFKGFVDDLGVIDMDGD